MSKPRHHRRNVGPVSIGQQTLSRSVTQALNIVTQTDERYAQSLSVMLVSLFETNSNNIINVFVLVPQDMPEHIIEKITRSIKKFSHNVKFFALQPDIYTGLRVVNHISSATYLKLSIDYALPANIRKVIYLDADILVRADIGELWRYDLGDSVVGAVLDEYVSGTVGRKIKARLGIDPDSPYFNSGVLVIDLDRWREANVGLNALRFVRDHADRMTYNDQCALNWVLRNRWTSLPDCWNLQTHGLVDERRWGYMEYTSDSFIRAKETKIIHFTGPSKPWHYMNNHPLKQEYIRYRLGTPWKNSKYVDSSPRNVIRKHLFKFAPLALRIHHEAHVRFPIWRRLFD
jgi:lipopolysaccharide biosynthesis glycosyltransferase